MSDDKNDAESECRPVLLEVETGKPLDPTSPRAAAAEILWDTQTTPEEREVFHRVTCLGSRDPEDIRKVVAFLGRMRKILAEAENADAWS